MSHPGAPSKYAILKNGTYSLSCTSHLWEKQDGIPEYWLAMVNLRYTVVTCVKGVYTKYTHCHVKNLHILRLSVGLQVFWDKSWSSKSFLPLLIALTSSLAIFCSLKNDSNDVILPIREKTSVLFVTYSGWIAWPNKDYNHIKPII